MTSQDMMGIRQRVSMYRATMDNKSSDHKAYLSHACEIIDELLSEIEHWKQSHAGLCKMAEARIKPTKEAGAEILELQHDESYTVSKICHYLEVYRLHDVYILFETPMGGEPSYIETYPEWRVQDMIKRMESWI